MQRIGWAVNGAMIACLAACQSPPAATMQSAERVTRTGIIPEYRVQEGDVLTVLYYGLPELDTQQAVRLDGKISLTYLPDMHVSHLTLAQLHAKLLDAYKGILRSPVITVELAASSSGRVFIGGEVFKPGEVALSGRASLVQMLFKAGGLKSTAAADRVVLIRHDPGGAEQRRYIDVSDILAGHAADRDIPLQPYDVVYVPQTFIAQADRAMDQYLRSFLPADFAVQSIVRNPITRAAAVSTTPAGAAAPGTTGATTPAVATPAAPSGAGGVVLPSAP